MKSKDAMLCWSQFGGVEVVQWPDVTGASNAYENTDLAAWTDYRKSSPKDRLLWIYIAAMTAMARDGVHPWAMHFALLQIEEYRETVADDMPLPP